MRDQGWSMRLGAALVVVLCSVSVAAAQAPQSGPAREAADAYLTYVRVVEKAAKLDELLPHLSAEALEMLEDPPDGMEAYEVLGMIQAMMPRDIAIVGAEVENENIELSATGMFEGVRGTAVIHMVREEGAWKVGREAWHVRHTVN